MVAFGFPALDKVLTAALAEGQCQTELRGQGATPELAYDPNAPWLTIDFEGTGLDFDTPPAPGMVPARGFLATFEDHQGLTDHIEWDVCPRTRAVLYNEAKVEKFFEITADYQQLVFHNSRIDLKFAAHLGKTAAAVRKSAKRVAEWFKTKIIHDTQGMSHVCKSSDPHDLKSLGILYPKINDNDEKALVDTCKRFHHWFTLKSNKHPYAGIPCVSARANYWLPRWVFRNAPTLARLGFAHEIKAEHADLCRIYAKNDPKRTAWLFRMFLRVLSNQGLWHNYERERRLIKVLYGMEGEGITLLPDNYTLARAEIEKSLTKSTSGLRTFANSLTRSKRFEDLNPNSPKQMGQLLFGDLKLKPTGWTESGAPSLDKNAIPALIEQVANRDKKLKFDHTQVDLYKLDKRETPEKMIVRMLKHFQHVKQSSTAFSYLKSYGDLAVDWRLRPEWNQWGTIFTRMSSSNPNGQNIGKRDMDALDEDEGDGGRHAFVIRSVFGPRPGKIWFSIDFNQLELRLMAHASGDPGLLKVLNDGVDQHQYTADAINAIRAQYGMDPVSRKVGKFFNFAFQYGAGEAKLSLLAGIPAADMREAMLEAYPGLMEEMARCIAYVKKHGYIETMFGYRLYIDRGHEYKGTNGRIQGTAGDLAKNAMLAIDRLHQAPQFKKHNFALLLQIHDEFIIEADESALGEPELVDFTRRAIEGCGDPIGCAVPVEINHTKTNWADLTPYAAA